jgi:hypothetical protein
MEAPTVVKLTNFSPFYLKEATALRLTKPILSAQFPTLGD